MEKIIINHHTNTRAERKTIELIERIENRFLFFSDRFGIEGFFSSINLGENRTKN